MPHRALLAFSTSFLLAGSALPAVAATSPIPQETPAHVATFRIGGIGDDAVPAQDPLGRADSRNFRECLALLRAAAEDDSLDGLRLEVDGPLSLSRASEVLRELKRVKARGKKLVCYAEGLDRNALLFATLADHLAVPSSGMLALESFRVEVLYLRDLLERFGVEFDVMHIGDFKTAFEQYSRDRMSEEQRLSLGQMMDELYRSTVRTLAQQRGLEERAVEALFAKMLLEPEEALAAGLIDAVEYEDQFEAHCEAVFGRPVEFDDDYGAEEEEDLEALLESPMGAFTLLSRLMNPPRKEVPEGPRVAVVYANGGIDSGKSSAGLDGETMGSETIVAALEDVLADDDVKAVVLRVNSPGGSALASDMIWRAIERVKERKPVIASMGDVAASGGYWISMGCTKIFAQPTTITGSIGVVSAAPNLRGALERFGVRVETAGAGPRVDDLSGYGGLSDYAKQCIVASMQEVYDQFLTKVSRGRGLAKERVAEIARGRVWTGRQAKDLGLVDALGGLDDALTFACAKVGLDVAQTPVVEYPEPVDFLTSWKESLEGLTQVRSPLAEALRSLGLERLEADLATLESTVKSSPADRIQARLPVHFEIR